MTRVLIATPDTLAPQMAGPAIRAWHMADALAAEHDVRLVTTAECSLSSDGFAVSGIGPTGFAEHAEWCEVAVVQGTVLHEHPVLGRPDRVVVADMYDPAHLEQLEQAKEAGEQRTHVVHATRAIYNGLLRRADLVLCASERQRDFWVGALTTLGRVNPATYDADPSLRALVATVPFGLPVEAPTPTGPGPRQLVTGIEPGDPLLIWGGGIYNWFDPLTLIRAVDQLRADVPDVRLLFLGLGHPNPAVPRMKMAADTIEMAKMLGIHGTHVFANESWVAYADRASWLLDANVGVSTHLDHIETAYSFRTRVLDYLWAGLPVVTTAGDALGDLVTAERLGIAVAPGDVGALRDALRTVLTDTAFAGECRDRVRATAPRFVWPVVLEPLLSFCRVPQRASDLVDPATARTIATDPTAVPRNPTSVRGDAALAKKYINEGGVRLLARKMASRLLRRP